MILINAVMEHILVPLMPHVPTQLAPTTVHASLDTVEMDKHALTLMNALMEHILVQLMLHVLIQRAHTIVYAKLGLLETEEME